MSGAPAIGALRHRVTLETPLDAIDESGSTIRSYAPLATLWAQVTAVGGEDRFIASRQEEAITHLVRIRWRADVAGQMRFALGSRRLLIHTAYDADERRRFLICRCEEIRS